MKKYMQSAIKLLSVSVPVITGILVTGLVLDEVGTNRRLGDMAGRLADKIRRGLNG